MKKKLLVLFYISLIVGCNPFGKNSIVNITNPAKFLESTNFDVNNGGKTAASVPASGSQADVHQVRFKVGRSFTQHQRLTIDGHSMEVSLKGKR